MSAATLPPLVPGLPVLGSSLALAGDLVPFIVEQYRRFGPVFRVRALNRELVVLAGPEANAFITQSGAGKFHSRDSWGPFGREFEVDDYLQVIEGEPHTRYRKLVKRGYSASNMLSNPALLVEIAQKVVDQYPPGAEVPALYFFRLIVTEQLGVLLANHAPGADLDVLIKTTKDALNALVVGSRPGLTLRLPAYRRARTRFLALGREILAEHRATTRPQPDLIDDVLAASAESGNTDLLGKEEQLVMAALGPFIAGLDTAANESTFMLYALLRHPDVLEQCVAEADQLFAAGVPAASQIRSLNVLHDAMMETLRLYGIAPAVTRTAAVDFEFNGYQVKQGANLLLATTAAHFLPELYADPYQFDITRYSEPRSEHKKKGAYAPFGIGTHTCLGAGAAELQIALALASVLHMVRFEAVNPQQQLPIRNNPTPTLGYAFRVRIAERRHHINLSGTPVPA